MKCMLMSIILYIHTFQVPSRLGLSSVMILKLPVIMAKSIPRPDRPLNGSFNLWVIVEGNLLLQIIVPEPKVGDFFVFPYDMRHCVYPFNTTEEHRRTLAANVDTFYNTPPLKL